MTGKYQEKLEQQLNEIIENAYYEDERLPLYQGFHLRLNTNAPRTYSGLYDMETKTIDVFDLSAKMSNNISTLLHEVSHHIDCVMHGTTGHQKPFYEIFARLLYSALDLRMCSLDDLQNMDYRNRDYRKVQKILADYERHEPHHKSEMKTYVVMVYNGYYVKDYLKNHLFQWKPDLKVWLREYETLEEGQEMARSLLKEGCLRDDIRLRAKTSDLHVSNRLCVYRCYEQKERLKEIGMRWDANEKCWYVMLESESEMNAMKQRIINCGVSADNIIYGN